MSQGKGLVGLAAVAAAAYTALTCGALTQAVRAADALPSSDSELTLSQPQSQAQSQAQPKYLDAPAAEAKFTPFTVQGAMGGTPVGDFMDKYKLTLTGFGEGSYTYNLRKTPGRANTDRVFDVEREHLALNQADISLARAIDFSSTNWDVGGLVEVQYGEDARFIHSNGLNFYGSNNPQLDPKQQFDLTQAYVTVNAPIGNGLKFTGGKFVTLLGYETINPTSNSLFSHTYLFGFAIPFTNTGITATYKFNDSITATAGITRGWDEALKDNNNDAIDYIGEVVYTPASVKGLTLTLNGITGPEATDNSRDYRSVLDLIAAYNYGDNWVFAFNGDYGFEPNAGTGGKDAKWYGGALYATYKIGTDGRFAVTGRGEYFNDDDGARGIGSEVYEATLGVEISPMPDNKYAAGLLFRPEIRYDYSKDPVFDGGTKHDQTTVGADLIYKF